MIITSNKYVEIGRFVRGFGCYYPEIRVLIHPPAILITYLFSVLKITPNFVSFITTIFSIGTLYFYSQESYFVAFLFYWVRTVLDYVDGALARYTNQCTKFGKYLDLTIDYFFYFSFWIYLAYAYYDIGIYILCIPILYILLIDYYVQPRLSSLKKREPLKQFFIDKGFILGFAPFGQFELWVFAASFMGVISKFILYFIILVFIDLLYRVYEVVRFSERKP